MPSRDRAREGGLARGSLSLLAMTRGAACPAKMRTAGTDAVSLTMRYPGFHVASMFWRGRGTFTFAVPRQATPFCRTVTIRCRRQLADGHPRGHGRLPPTLLGIGLCTAAEAASLTGIPALRIRRWLAGYVHSRNDARNWSDPLWTPQLPRIGQDIGLGFRDLMELRIVAVLVAAGISLHSIRRALAIGRQVVGEARPFSTARSHTDGRTIFLRVSREVDEPVLIDLLRPNTPDEVWISALGAEGGWSVLSGDVRIARRPTEKLPWHRCG
jgi:hypothetical protein